MRHPARVLVAFLMLGSAASAAPAQEWRGIWVAAPGDIWLAGNAGLAHGRAGSWVTATVPAGLETPTLNAVLGFGPNDVWAVGNGGTILHWNGTQLSRPWGGSDADLIAIFGCAANDIWVVGQSEDMSQPPVMLHYNGSSWSVTRLNPPFRPTAIAGSCVANSGSGGGDLVVSGISYFDPRPDQRRDIGVIARMRGGQWTTSGWDGRRVTDEQIAGTAWTGVAAGGGSVLIWGPGKAMLSRAGGAWTPFTLPGATVAAAIGADGTPVAIHAAGFSRFAGGQWRTVGQGGMETSAGNAYSATAQNMSQNMQRGAAKQDTAAVRRISERLEAIGRAIPEGGMPNQAQMTEMMQLQQQLVAANGGSMMPPGMNMQQMQQMSTQAQAASAEAQRNQAVATRNATLRFGEHPGVFAGPGSDFYVVGEAGAMHITGDASKLVFTSMCAYQSQQQAQGIPSSVYADCRADGGTGGAPAAMTMPPPAPHVEGPAVQAPSRTNPLPSITKPRIRIP